MATVQEPTRAAGRHESFVDAQIARASRRIRAQDVGAAALGLVLGTLVYALVMVLLDRWLDLSERVRQAALAVYLVGAGVYAAIVLSRPFRRQINPYFAARQMERAVPSAKNSVVNWLDLRDRPLAPTIRSALGAQAAGDLTKADLDQVLHDRRINWLGGAAGALAFTALLLLFILRPAQFLSLVGRAFAPFASASIARQTELVLVHPEHGDITIPVNQSIEFRVLVHGRVPDPSASDAVQLRMKYSPADPAWDERRFEPTARDPREWAVRVPSVAVQNGFVYQVVGGDAATPEYRVSVRSSPLIEGFEVTYRHRPYLRMPEQHATNPNIEALRGTHVALTVRTNRQVKDGWLRFDKAENGADVPSIAAQLVPDQPNALRFEFVLDRSGRYRVHFQSLDGDANQDPIPYTIKALNDHPPQVNIVRSVPDGLAINGTFMLDGKASDDFGLTKMRLCGRLLGSELGARNSELRTPNSALGMPLVDRPFRDGKSFQFGNGGYPQALDYKEALPLEQWKLKGPVQTPLQAGMIIEYWLEAEDNCDYPGPNVGKSQVYRVTLGEPKKEDERRAANDEARADKQNFDRQQDQDLQKENEAKAGNGAGNDAKDQPPQDQGAKPDQNPGGEGNADQQAADAKANEIAKQLAKQLQRKDNEARQPKGEAKPDRGADGANQQQGGDNQQQPGGANQQKPDGAGEKPDQKQGGKDQGAGGANQQKPDGAGGKDQQQQPGGAGAKPDQKQGGKDQGAGGANQQKPDGAGGRDQQQQPGGAGAKPDQKQGGKDQGAGGANQQKPDGAGGKDQQQQPGGAGAKRDQKQGGKDQGAGGANQPKPDGAGGKDQQQQPGGAGAKPDQKQGGKDQGAGGAKGEPKPDGAQGNGQNAGEAKADKSPSGGADKGQAKNEGNQSSPPQPGAAKGNPDGQPNGAGGDKQEQPGHAAAKPDQQGQGANQPKPDGKGNPSPSPMGDQKGGDAAQPGDGAGQPKPGEAKPNSQGDGAKPGDAKGAPLGGGDKAGETKSAPGAKDGNAAGGPGDQKPDQPQGKDDKGAGGAGGKGESKGEGTKPGPKGNPAQRDPKAVPDGNDPGQSGPPGTKPSGKPDSGGPGDDAVIRPGDGKGIGKPEAAPPKGESKPDPADARPGTTDKPGELVDAPKGAGPGAKPKSEPKTAGTPGGEAKPDAAPGDQKANANEMVRKASDLVKKMTEMAKDGVPKPDGQTARDLAEKAQQAAKNQKELADALKNADPKLVEDLANNLKQLDQQLAKNDGGKPQGEPKPSKDLQDAARQLAQAMQGAGKPGGEPNPDLQTKGQQPGTGQESKNGEPSPMGGGSGDGTNAQNRPDGEGPRVPVGPGETSNPDPRHAARAGEMLLEDFRKKVDRKMLDELKMSEEEYAEFLRTYEAMVQRQKAAAAAEAKDRERGAAKGGSAANSAAKRVQAGATKSGNLERGGAVLPPPEMRDGYKGFTEDVSKTGTKPKDK